MRKTWPRQSIFRRKAPTAQSPAMSKSLTGTKAMTMSRGNRPASLRDNSASLAHFTAIPAAPIPKRRRSSPRRERANAQPERAIHNTGFSITSAQYAAGDTRLRHGKVVGVSLVVDDLPDALRYFRQALGLPLSSTQREENAFGSVRSFRFDAGAHWIELLHRPGAAGVRPLNERGLMNIALGVRRPRDFRAIYQRVLNNGFTSSTPPIGGALSNVVYLRSRQGVSVELLQLPAWMDAIWGFRAPGALARLVRSAISWLVGGRTGQTRR